MVSLCWDFVCPGKAYWNSFKPNQTRWGLMGPGQCTKPTFFHESSKRSGPFVVNGWIGFEGDSLN